jgi:hypothetical protein
MAIKRNLASLMIGLALAGCSPLAPRPNYTKYFVLAPVTDTAAAVPAGSTLAIGLGPVAFPGYLERIQVVTRSSPTQIELSPVGRWGEPLDKNFKRVLAENLTRLLGTCRIEEYPWSHEAKVDYQVAIQVENFETTPMASRCCARDGLSRMAPAPAISMPRRPPPMLRWRRAITVSRPRSVPTSRL